MNEFLDILCAIILVRSVFLIACFKLNGKLSRTGLAYRYCTRNNSVWIYRLFGISALWLIVRYYENIF